jgi:hypothetical protein
MTDQPRAGKAHRCPHRSPRRSPCVPHRHRVARPPRAAAAAAAPGPMIMRNTPIRTPQVRFCSARGIRSPSAPLRAGRRASVSSMRASGSAASGSSGTAAWTPRAQQPVAGSAVPSGCAADPYRSRTGVRCRVGTGPFRLGSRLACLHFCDLLHIAVHRLCVTWPGAARKMHHVRALWETVVRGAVASGPWPRRSGGGFWRQLPPTSAASRPHARRRRAARDKCADARPAVEGGPRVSA